jgi:hypothetical protein
MTAALSDWPAEALLQPLPCPVTPVLDETLQSYLRRLASANGMSPLEFTGYVRGSKRISDPIPPQAVITLSGQSPDSMRYAILELCSPRELAVMNVAGRPRPGHSRQEEKCTRCIIIRGIYDYVTCWRRSEDVICLPHRRWTTGAEQLDLTGHKDVIQANKQHRQLIRLHGRATASRAFRQASEIVGEWAERRSYHACLYERMRRFHGGNWSVGHDDPTWLAAQYLLAVPLARLLASPDWKALALHPQGNAAFVAEVRRTIDPDYVWNPYPYWRYTEPLARILLEEREDAEGLATLAEYRRTHGRPEPPSEIIESGELCQDN